MTTEQYSKIKLRNAKYCILYTEYNNQYLSEFLHLFELL